MKNTVKRKPDIFSDAVQANIKRSMFQRNSTKKTTFNASELIPIYVDEVLPGDTFDMKMSFVTRMATPLFPTMDNIQLDFYAFFVPNRLVWSGWEELNGENKTGAWAPSEDPALVPFYYRSAADATVERGSLADYMDIPVGAIINEESGGISSLPFRAYYLIWNEWFRDQNLQAPLPVRKDNTPGVIDLAKSILKKGSIVRANKKHDYFTSCLPAPQKGQSQLIPIELNALIPVITGDSNIPASKISGNDLKWLTSEGNRISSAPGDLIVDSNGERTWSKLLDGGVGGEQVIPSNLFGDARGYQMTSTTISDLRTAFQLQKLYEKDARGGTRYVEMLKAHFGVDAQDYRLQRPEFLGKMSSFVGIHQVAQTSSTDDTSPQGNVAAFAYGSGSGSFFKKSFVEHGHIIILACARQRKTYQQGIDKLYFRKDRFDFYYPALAHISEQPVYKKEIFANVNTMKNNPIFGYQEAWAEYRYKPSKVSGMMRSSATDPSFDAYHYADYYSAVPALSNEFIKDNSKENVERTLAVGSELSDQILLDVAFDLRCIRPMPVTSIPGLVDHF